MTASNRPFQVPIDLMFGFRNATIVLSWGYFGKYFKSLLISKELQLFVQSIAQSAFATADLVFFLSASLLICSRGLIDALQEGLR